LEIPAGSSSVTADKSALLQMCRSTPPLATFCKLAFMKPPTHSLDTAVTDTAGNAISYTGGRYFNEVAWGKDLVAVVVAVQRARDRDLSSGKYDRPGKERSSKDKDASVSKNFWCSNTTVHIVLYLASTLETAAGAAAEIPEEGEIADSANAKFENARSINEMIAEKGFALLSREHTRFATGASNLGFGPGRNEARGRRGELGNFLLAGASAPSTLFSGADCNPVVAVTYGRIHAAFSRAYQSHAGVYKYGDPGDSDDEETSASSVSGPGAKQAKKTTK
jgi:hypothetical protein